jgi:phosphopantothenoylcysteine decarboxylase / phosphopantothenate---cysteine ligase
MHLLPETDVLIGSAAVADYRPTRSESRKIKKLQEEQIIHLEPTPDILKTVGAQRGPERQQPRLVVGFAAETDDLEANAREKLEHKNLDFIVLNDITAQDSGFAVDTNRVIIFERDGQRDDWPLMSKEEVAQAIMQKVAARLGRRTWRRR